ncbi:MAG: large-conductance mechanosensitive channel protein MscL [Elusimicrobia bacterium]|nr:large-conductance mechanosensitive channel protein MscL [Elusimicrobiota bacterium]
MSVLSEFKQFAMRGNVVDMAVGVVIGGAFGKIVTSLVNDMVMPVVGALTGGVDIKDKALTLTAPLEGVPAVTLRYGAFINTVLDFIIIAFAIFMAMKVMNKVARTNVVTIAGPTK